jgi:hypothetical protein
MKALQVNTQNAVNNRTANKHTNLRLGNPTQKLKNLQQPEEIG